MGFRNRVTSATPSGAAGGDLAGSFPSPTIGAGKVTSAMIADGAIVNADVSASAAIAASKLSGVPVGGQAAIADLNLGTLVLLTDVITAVGTVQTKVNTLLAELRTSTLLAT